MVVSATVRESCAVDAGPLVFGTVDSLAPARAAQAVLTVACTPGAGFTVTLDEGRNGGGGERRMADAGGTRFLAYDIYHDAAGARRWSAASPATGIAPAGGAVTLSAYGRISARSAAAGDYGDVVTVSIEF